MKKAFVLILSAVLIITVFAGCNSNSIKQALSGKEPESIASEAEGSSTELLGGWIKAETPEITDEFMKIFNKATETLTGVEYTPVAYIASQVVAGRNHCVLCKAKASVPDAEEVYAILYIYEDLQGNASITEIYDYNYDELDFSGWEETETPVITDEAKSTFDKAAEKLTGSSLRPLAFVAAKGGACCLLCEESTDSESHFAFVIIKDDSVEKVVPIDRGTADNNVEAVNPVVGYQTLDEAEKAVGFDITVPADIKQIINYSVIDNEILEIEFKGGYIRKAKEVADISGDYNMYKEKTVEENGIGYTFKGDGSNVSLAIWTDGAYSYCLGFDEAVSESDMLAYVSAVK